MALDFEDSVTRELREYVRKVTAALGLSGECSLVQADSPASAYVAVDGHLPGFPDRDVALVWDERHGWAAAVETHSGEDLIVQARLDGDLQPPPGVVASWAQSTLRGEPVPTQRVGDLTRRLRGRGAGDLTRIA